VLKGRVFLSVLILLGALSTHTAHGGDLAGIDTLLRQGATRQALQALHRRQAGPARDDDALLWRLAQAHYELGRTSNTARDRAEHLQRAEIMARQAMEVAPHSDEGYKWLAITLGAQAEAATVKKQILLSRQVRENIEQALAHDPDDDISLLVLSRWHYKIASLGFWARTLVKLVYGGLPEASFEKAEALLWQAITQQDRIAHRYALAKVYNRMGRRAAALEQLEKALTLPVTFPEEAEDLGKAQRKLQRWR
jgi:tetratricopeptide (TPR) repeat protein